MRHLFRALGICAALVLAQPVFAADGPAPIKGLWLTTDYPALTARAGESTTVKLKLQNVDLAPERVALSVANVPAGWSAVILGGGAPVGAAMPATNDNVALQLRIDVPAGAPSGSHTMTLNAVGGSGTTSLPIEVTIGQDLPAKLAIKSKLPSLIGTPKTSFAFDFNVTNQGDRDLVIKLAAQAPAGFQTSFTESYGTQELSSIPIAAGQNKDLKVKVQPPGDVAAGNYPVKVVASAENAQAEQSLAMQITGQAQLHLSGQDGRLSTAAEAGKASPVTMVVSNDGSAPARGIALSATPPADWKVTFQPDTLAELAPGAKQNVQALITPSAKAVAGDYMTTFRADGKGASSSADIRVTVSTSTLWGIVGVGLVAIALLIAVGAVARFGRR